MKLRERDIEDACTDLLALDGWRCIKTDLRHLRGLGVQEKGMADRLYLRYNQIDVCGLVAAIWIEWKRPKGVVASHQAQWHQKERALGALTLIAGVDFVATVDGFLEWYRETGFMRQNLTLGREGRTKYPPLVQRRVKSAKKKAVDVQEVATHP